MDLLEKVIQEGLTPTCMTILCLDKNVGIFDIPIILKMKIENLEVARTLATPKEKMKMSRSIKAYMMLLDLLENKVYVNTPRGIRRMNIGDIVSSILLIK